MKKFSKFFSVLLTSCLVLGLVSVFASATTDIEPTNNGYSYNFENDNVNADYSSKLPSGTGSATSFSSVKVADSGLGNKYVRYAYIAASNEKTYRRDIMLGKFSNTDSDTLTHISDYAYYTVDFDLSADSYSVFVGYKLVRGFSTTTHSSPSNVTVTVNGTEYTAALGSTRTHTYSVSKLYKNYTTLDDAKILEDIAATHNAFIADLNTYHANIIKESSYTVTESNTDGSPKTVRLHKYTSSVLSKDVSVSDFVTSKGYATVDGDTYATTVTLEAAKASKRLSYSDGSHMSIDNRPVSGTTALNKTSGYTCLGIKLNYKASDGLWHIYLNRGTDVSDDATYVDTGLTLSNNLGEWNHFTYAICPSVKEVTNNGTTYSTYGYTEVRLYYNGYYVDKSNINTSGSWNYRCDDVVVRAIDWEITNYTSEYSMGIDNIEATFYPKGYSTDENTVGIDDLFKADSTLDSIAQCEDTFYNSAYVSPAPNRCLEVGGEKIYVPSVAKYALSAVKNGDVINTPFDLLEIDPPAWTSFTIKCDSNTKVTLSEEAIAKGSTIQKTATGYAVGAGIKANMSLFEDMKFNLYLPKIEGIEITGVEGAELNKNSVSVGGVEMFVISAQQSVNSFESIEATVTYTAGGKTYQYKATLDPLDYATRVAKAYDCGSEEAALIYEMISYKEAIAKMLDSDFAENDTLIAFKELYESHADCNCTATAVNISTKENAVNYSALIEKGITSIAYRLSLSEIGMIINVNDGVTVDSVGYVTPMGATVSHTVENGKLVKRDGYYLVTGVNAAYIDEIMTITVDGVSGTYCLGKYISNNPTVEVAKNLYKYAVAADNYKTVTVSELTVGVEAIREIDAVGESYYVKGYYVGFSDEGSGYQKEILLKDIDSNALIAVRNVPYGAYPDYGYEKGDLVRLHATIVEATDQNKRYLVATENNPEDIEKTILSRSNRISYNLDEAVDIESWEDTVSFFNVETIEAYTYVHFKGTMYMNTYSNAKDGVLLYRPHFNSKASALSNLKPDGSRAVGLRENMLNANTGTAWRDYFGKYIGSGSYPGKTMEVDFYAVYTAANSVNFQITVLDATWFTGNEEYIVIENNQDIIKEVAYAYQRQGNQIHYDQGLRNSDPSPEDATSQHMLYLDCSSFVNAAYVEAFGVNVMDKTRAEASPNTNNYTIYAKEGLGVRSDVLGYWENRDYATEEERAELLASISSQLEVGDIIVYRRGTSVEKQSGGHTVLYVGDGLFLHSIGSQYIYDKNEPQNSTDYASSAENSTGTVLTATKNDFFTTTGGRYLFASNIVTIALLRPLNRELTPTEKTLNRVNLAGLTMEKTVSTGLSGAAAKGELVTYTLNIHNRADNVFKNVAFEEILDEGVTFVSGSTGLTLNGNVISATLDINGKDNFNLTWTVRVDDDATVGDRIQNTTSLGGVDIFNDLSFTVSGYTEAQLLLVVNAAKEYAKSGESFTDPIGLANAVYKSALGRDLFTYDTVAEIIEELYGTGSLNKESEIAKMIVPTMFGGKSVGGRASDDSRVRRMYESTLEIGDVIICSWSTNARVFIYVGDGMLVSVDNLTNTTATLENGNEAFVKDGSAYYLKSILGTIVAYEEFAVIRPSMSVN